MPIVRAVRQRSIHSRSVSWALSFAGATGGEGEEDGESAGPKLPSFPDYDGLLYKAGAALPRGMEEISYGPEASTNNQPVV